MTSQTITAPSDADIGDIARALIHADDMCQAVLGKNLSGTREDLGRIQEILDSGFVEQRATYSLQALGMAFGKVFVNTNPGFDWWMVEDEHGRDPAIRYNRTTLLAFPRTMLSKRIEDGESVDVEDLYEKLGERLSEMIRVGYGAV